MQWQTRDSSGAIISCQLETPTEEDKPLHLLRPQNLDSNTRLSRHEERAKYLKQDIDYSKITAKNQNFAYSETPKNNETNIQGSPSRSNRQATSYNSQSEVHNDIYKRLPNKTDNINNQLLINSRNHLPTSLDIPNTGGPTIHLLPHSKETCSQRPKTPTIEEENVISLNNYERLEKKPNTLVDQTTQTILSLPVIPRQIQQSPIKEFIKLPKISVSSAPLGVPSSVPCLVTANGSPISPRQSSRRIPKMLAPKSPKILKSPRSPKGNSNTNFFLSESSIKEEDSANPSESVAIPNSDNNHAEQKKVVWTNQNYNDRISVKQ